MQVITLNKEALLKKCSELFSNLEIQPDMVVGILNGGRYLLNDIKNQNRFNCNQFHLLKLSKNNSLKDLFFVRFILKKLPYAISNRLRVYESTKVRKSINSLNINELFDHQIEFDFNSIKKETIKVILIVDDAIDTGRTMFMVKRHLEKLFPDAKIITLVISWTLENSIVKPDYYLFKNVLVRFPWSQDYKEKDFE